jgi:TolB-like protein/DNA-binding winged helix-turn-helix (wHTH) protein/tetratricopeptide (TPR) repeat protein
VSDPVSGFKVDDLVVDVGRARVTRCGQEVPLTRLSFDLLLALIEVAPNLLTTDELLSRVWPGLVVGPETISQRVKLLRSSLGDDAKQPRYIAAVRGRGYRLLVDPVPVTGVIHPAIEPVPPPVLPKGQEVVLPDERVAQGALAPVGSGIGNVGTRLAVAGTVILVALLTLLVQWVRAPEEPAIESSRTAGAGTEPPSVAVLRFRNLGATAESEAFAIGLSEGVLHRLSELRGMTAIARTSSFAVSGGDDDARAIGRKLDAAYLVDGSVQSDRARLRVTVSLIDARSGRHLWSQRFDRVPQDVFAVQDEIAAEVARSLELSLGSVAAAGTAGRETRNFEAYLAYMQARRLLGTLRVADLPNAIAYLERAIRLDPGFVSAHVELAGAVLQTAEFAQGSDRAQRFAAARVRAAALIDRAIALNPADGAAYVQRGFLHAYTDLARAEADFRLGIELAPHDSRGYEGLAATLFEDPTRTDDVRAALEQARRLDPLEPRHDVTMYVLEFYGLGRVDDAEASLLEALRKDPLYAPALMRLGELRWVTGHWAEGVRYGEQMLAIDPQSDWTRRYLVRAYLELGEPDAARSLLEGGGATAAALRVPILLYEQDWMAAGEAAYDAVNAGMASPIDEVLITSAIRMHARETGDFVRARDVLARWSHTVHDAEGLPVSSEERGMRVITAALAEVLMVSGETAAARNLLETLLGDMDHDVQELGRGDFWNSRSRPQALMLLGRPQEAIAALARYVGDGVGLGDWWFVLEVDPVFESVRGDPEFQRLVGLARASRETQRARLAELRAAGVVPDRRAVGVR